MEKNIRYNNNPLKLNEILFKKNENCICIMHGNRCSKN